MKTNRHVEYSFLASGYVNSTIVLTDDSITPDKLMVLLNTGDATTSVVEGQDVILWADIAKPKVIGVVNSTEPEMDYEEFDIIQVTDFPVETPLPPFDLTRISLAGAIAEFIFEPEKSTTEIMQILTVAGGHEPELVVEEQYSGLSGKQLLKEIDLMERGLKSLMSMAYDAGKLGQELV